MPTSKVLIPLEEAYELLKSAFSHQNDKRERLFLTHCLGRYLAESAPCRMDHPGFDQSAMDGIAFRWKAKTRPLRLIGTMAAGDRPDTLVIEGDDAARIMTGAPIPQGADTVMMIEKVRINDDTCWLEEPGTSGQHIRFRGENMKQGDVLAEAGVPLTAARIAALTAQGISDAVVKPRLRIGIATTGNEIIPHFQPLRPGQIHNSNAPALEAFFSAPDLACMQLGVLPDDLEQTTACLAKHTDLDVLVLTGGVSMGDFDFVPAAAEAAGFKPHFHKVRMKPGKPVWVGRHDSGTWLFGLPGNPVSALVGATLFIQPVLNAMRTGRFQPPHKIHMPLASGIKNHSKFPFFQGCQLVIKDGVTCAKPVKTSGSGDILRFGASELLLCIPPKEALNPGAPVEVLLPLQGVIG